MKKDIEIRKVTDIAIAVVPDAQGDLWDVYLINLKDEPIKSVLVNSRGYGEREGEQVRTSNLRYFYEELPAQAALKIEFIPKELFDLAHEYWLSFSHDGFLFDKKYVFVAGSLDESNFTRLPILEERGIMIR